MVSSQPPGGGWARVYIDLNAIRKRLRGPGSVTFVKVAGHSDNRGNREADLLAVRGAALPRAGGD